MHAGFHGSQLAVSRQRTLANSCEQPRTVFSELVAQREMPFFQALPLPTDAPKQAIAMCQSEADAIKASLLAPRVHGWSDSRVAKALGYSRSYFSEIKSGKKPMPAERIEDFCRVTGTNLLRQYRDLQRAIVMLQLGDTESQRVDRISHLLRSAA